MKDIDASPNLQLQIILPINHHNFDSILNEFDCTYITTEVKAIHDYGHFYSECLKIMSDIKPNIVLCLGDRWEMLVAATTALLLNIPIVHLYGGETTIGSFDDEIRNSITQMATYHFTATEQYARNVARMRGLCAPDHYSCMHKFNFDDLILDNSHIFNVGSTGLDWLTRSKLLTKDEITVPINLNLPFIVACYNPVTKELPDTERQIKEFCVALDKTGEQILFIMPNTDPCNEIIRQVAQSYDDAGRYSDCKPHLWHCVDNLDHLTYLSLLQYAELMVGNSSSGIIESPSFNIPSISVGNRQDGRIKGSNTFTCPCETDAILDAIDRAREWNALTGKCDNPYGSGNSSKKIVEMLEEI